MPRIVPLLAALALGCHGADETMPIPELHDCAPGAWQRDDGSCVPAGLPPDMPCPPAEWLREEDRECIPAGVPPDGCGQGFVHDDDRGCEPMLPEEPCPRGLMAIPGETACRAIAPCAPGRWGDIPVEPDTEYVDARYSGIGSDGTALKPWTSIQTAVDAAAPGSIIAIAEGSYLEDVHVSGKPVRLWGVCPARVDVVGTGAKLATIVVYTGASGTEVRNVSVGGDALGIAVSGSRDVVIDRVWVHGTKGHGVNVQNDLGPTSLVVNGALVEQTNEVGIFAQGTEVSVTASVVRNTEPNAQGLFGRGVHGQDDPGFGASSALVLRTSLVEQNRNYGISVIGSEAMIEACVVRDTQPSANGEGMGVVASRNSTTGAPSKLVLRQSLVEKSHEMGLWIAVSDATVEANVIRNTQPDAVGQFGRGVHVEADQSTGAPANLLLRTTLLTGNHEIGVFAVGSNVAIEASVIRDTQPDALGFGRGAVIEGHPYIGTPSTLLLESSLLERNHDLGVSVIGSEATVEATIVRSTLLDVHGRFGRGVNVEEHPVTGAPSTLLLRSSLVAQNHSAGIYIAGSEVTVETSAVQETNPDALGHFGRGVHVEESIDGAPSRVFLSRLLVERSRDFGVLVLNSNATLEASIVRDTLPREFDGTFGDGVTIVDELGGSAIDIRSARIEKSPRGALAVFGASLLYADSDLRCQSVDLIGESYAGRPFRVENVGGNRCGCPDVDGECVLESANFAAPEALDEGP